MSTEKIRVCHVQCLPMVAGAQRTMLQIFDVLNRERYEPSVICQGPGPLSEELAQRDIPIHFVPSLVRPINPLRDWKAVKELEKLFLKIKPEIVHTHSSKPGFVGRRAAYLAGVPHIIHHVQGYAFHEFSSWPKKFLFQTMESMAAKWSTRIIFVSQEERDASIARGWVHAGNSNWIPNVVDRAERVVDVHRINRLHPVGSAFALDIDQCLFHFGLRSWIEGPVLAEATELLGA